MPKVKVKSTRSTRSTSSGQASSGQEVKSKRSKVRAGKHFKFNFTAHKFPLRQVLGIIFVILGMLFLYKVPTPNQVRADEPIVASRDFKTNDKSSQVKRILLPKQNIDLPVVNAKIVNGYWETAESTASHGENTANPGTSGNVVVFAHAREGLFYNLKDVKKGDIVYIFTKDNWYRYKVNDIATVYPNDITVVAPTKSETLTLFTCSGFFDEKRLIVKALPAK